MRNKEPMELANQNIKWYESAFDAIEQGLNGEKSAAVHSMRRNAIRRFKDLGFPTKHQEEWRFTDIDPITKIAFQPVHRYELNGITRKDIQQYLLNDTHLLVFVNGMFSPELSDLRSLPQGVITGSLRELLNNHSEAAESSITNGKTGVENGFTALNTAFLWDGAYISVPPKMFVDAPFQILFVASRRGEAYAAQPRNFIIAGMESRFKIIETYTGLSNNSYLTNAVTDISLGENSEIEHEKLQIEGMNGFHVGTTAVDLGRASRYISNSISLGGSIVRNNLTARFTAEEAECVLNGLSLGAGSQIVDNHTVIDHAKPHCTSHELYKAILDGASKGVFNGKVFVRIDAQKTDAKQTNKTLLLSDNATMNTKPQLEIFADDVKCTHGAAIGQLDEEQIFYCRSRGFDLDAARDILTSAFASDVVNRIAIESFRRQVDRTIQDRLKNQLSD